ncbi:MFS transporter superfamily [Fusarium oxysporum f. sp. vasinfectum]|nr:MFS transporter superfamily [Fusarium oxysporum f. sp. vasinfectum]KAK2930646.1 MFS transporter superfamily [Fusarium oxysporum f. sp. vasinfectum]
MSAWRWLFIFDFTLAIPAAAYEFITFPDTPHTTGAICFNEWERERSRQRIEKGVASLYVMQYSSIYLKNTGWYTVPEVNNIPTCIGAVNFVVMVSIGYIADKLGGRALVCCIVGFWMILNYSILTAWDVPHKLRMAAFIMHSCYGCFTPLIAG